MRRAATEARTLGPAQRRVEAEAAGGVERGRDGGVPAEVVGADRQRLGAGRERQPLALSREARAVRRGLDARVEPHLEAFLEERAQPWAVAVGFCPHVFGATRARLGEERGADPVATREVGERAGALAAHVGAEDAPGRLSGAASGEAGGEGAPAAGARRVQVVREGDGPRLPAPLGITDGHAALPERIAEPLAHRVHGRRQRLAERRLERVGVADAAPSVARPCRTLLCAREPPEGGREDVGVHDACRVGRWRAAAERKRKRSLPPTPPQTGHLASGDGVVRGAAPPTVSGLWRMRTAPEAACSGSGPT